MEMSQVTLHWLFSTIAQTYGAILGLMGLLVVYRLENFSNIRGACKKRSEDPMNLCFAVLRLSIDARGLTPEGMVDQWDNKIREDQKDELKKLIPTIHDKVNEEVKRILRHLNWSTLIKRLFAFLAGFHLCLTLFSIYGVYSAKKELTLCSEITHGVLMPVLFASFFLIVSFLYSLFDDRRPWEHLIVLFKKIRASMM